MPNLNFITKGNNQMKFNELNDQQKVNYIREEIFLLMEKFFTDEKSAIQSLGEKPAKELLAMKSKLLRENCDCGSCFNVHLFNAIMPPELDPVIDLAKSNLNEKVF